MRRGLKRLTAKRPTSTRKDHHPLLRVRNFRHRRRSTETDSSLVPGRVTPGGGWLGWADLSLAMAPSVEADPRVHHHVEHVAEDVPQQHQEGVDDQDPHDD